MTSQPRKQTIAMNTLPNISRSKGNQTMKFDQLIEYNIRKFGGEATSRPFSKKS